MFNSTEQSAFRLTCLVRLDDLVYGNPGIDGCVCDCCCRLSPVQYSSVM